jgi:sulfoxide reductase heme-binding subunit YedZ
MSNILLWYATRGAGMTVLILLTAVVALGVMSSSRPPSESWPRFLSTGLHRNLALLSLVFLAIHIVTAAIDPFTHLGWAMTVVPFSSYYRSFWLGLGTLAFDLLAAVLITSWLRNWIGYSLWRAIHWLTYAAWPIGLVHAFGTGTDALSPEFLALAGVCVAVVVYAVAYRISHGSSDELTMAKESFRTSAEQQKV